MINRILIRIKVVQMLYAYLLTRNEFKLLPSPTTESTEDSYAYSVYLNALLTILRLAGYSIDHSRKANPIRQTNLSESNMLSDMKITKALATNASVKAAMMEFDGSESDCFKSLIPALYSVILNSAIYADYRKKKRHDLEEEVKFWTVIINTILTSNNKLLAQARTNSDFSLNAYRRGMSMAAETLKEYADSQTSFAQAKKSLTDSLDKAYELYHALLMLPVYITDAEAERIEAAKEKYCPTDEELNPNMRFVNNTFVERIRNNYDMHDYVKAHPFSWESDFFMLKDLMDSIRQSEIYKEYMNLDEVTPADDCELWRNLLRTVVFPSDALAEALESKSVFWNDDLAIMGTFVLKTIKHFATAAPGAQVELLPNYKDDEDARFGPELFLTAIKEQQTYRSYIDRFINDAQWDTERLAFMDIVILLTAIAELIKFPAIPLAVTMNEYVEIANYYSTPRSGQFVNGILFSIANYLRQQGVIMKS